MSTARPDEAIDFDGFYHAHFRETVGIVYSYTGDLTEAQDIAQEAFARAWPRWKVIAEYDNPVYWVRRVATNLAHSRWRRAKVATAYLVRQRADDIPELSPDSVDIVRMWLPSLTCRSTRSSPGSCVAETPCRHS